MTIQAFSYNEDNEASVQRWNIDVSEFCWDFVQEIISLSVYSMYIEWYLSEVNNTVSRDVKPHIHRPVGQTEIVLCCWWSRAKGWKNSH